MLSPRFDFAIIFGHGMRNADPIKQIIRKHFPIVFLKQFDMLNVASSWSEQRTNIAQALPTEQGKALLVDTFINRLYGCDRVPLEHLFSKTRFLHTVPTTFLFCLLYNEAPDEAMVGVGTEFEHIQCRKITAMKNEIRDKFNPRAENGARLEHHVIHTSDFSSQVEHVLQMLGLPSLSFFSRVPNENFNVAYHVDPFDTYTIEEIHLSEIRINLANAENLTIEQTPHYKYILGYKDEYEDYCRQWVGVRDYADHCPETFDKLIAEFRYDRRHYILVRKIGPHYITQDGNHRLSILAAQGVKTIPVVLLNPPHSNRIDMGWLFQYMPCRYTILRKTLEFPAYLAGSDLDILTDNKERLAQHLLKFSVLCKVDKFVMAEHDGHTHIDFMFENKLDIRFDLVSNLQSCGLSDEKAMSVLANAVPAECGGLNVYVPDYLDDLLLRFAEWKTHPNKIKHLEHIRNRINDGFYTAVTEHLGMEMNEQIFNGLLKESGLA